MVPGSPEKLVAQLKLLNELSCRLPRLLESDTFHQEVVKLIQAQFNWYSVHLWTVASDHSARLEAQAGANGPLLPIGCVLPPHLGITGQVVRTQRSYLASDVSNDPNYSTFSIPLETAAQASVPVLWDRKCIGVLTVESLERGSLDPIDVLMLESVAAQVAVAVSNRRNFAEARDFSQKLQSAVEAKTEELRKAHERILEQQQLLQQENKALKSLVSREQADIEMVGRAPSMLSIVNMVDKIAPTTATVLIQGESGTGKELIARRLHRQSERQGQPYVTVNCGALQESLLESELFGHEKGAFTGAVNQKLGLCETANGGTLFLDEIGELSLGVQAKLLRFLQEGEFYRIGGKRPIRVDVRIISATNRDLEQEVRENRFREDLFYRLNTITLRMPPLRERKEDVRALVDSFLKNPRLGGHALIRKVDPRVYEALSAYDWPGNIRELQNTIERLKILAENQEIRLDDLPFGIRSPKTRAAQTEFTLDMSLDDVEKNHILRTLAYHQGNKTRTAQSLGVTIKTLYNKLHRYGILKTPSLGG